MTLSRLRVWRFGMCVAVALLCVLGWTLISAEEVPVPPWEVWRDLRSLPQLEDGHRVLLRSSRCPSGCRYDRHSADSWRYLRVDGDEGVVFEAEGAGAITRIWMTMGEGTSVPLVDTIRIRFYLDGASTPTVDLPLPALFDGSTAPFVPPLAGDREDSSGGNYSYVPIAYREGCRITLEGAHEERIWFQFTYHQLVEADGVTTFAMDQDFSAWAAMLALQGEDPWLLGSGLPATTVASSGVHTMAPGERVRLQDMTVADTITALRLSAPRSSWNELELVLSFDGEERVRMPLADFFGVGLGSGEIRSLLIGVAADDELYCYFPMPFELNAAVDLDHRGGSEAAPVEVAWTVRRDGVAPAPGSAPFTARLFVDPQTTIGEDIPLLDLQGSGRWVGLSVRLGSVETLSRQYLEGDERVYIDSSRHPMIYGTGTEDIFNGGFYFDQGPFGMALHGAPDHLVAGGEDTTTAYRLMLTDAVSFAQRLRVGLEGGPWGDLSLRVRAVFYAYADPQPRLWRSDVLDLGRADDREAHDYAVEGAFELKELDALTESEPPSAHRATGIYRPPGTASFVMRVHPEATRLRLRRLLDAGSAGQQAEIWVDGVLSGKLPYLDANSDRRWREVDLDLPLISAQVDGEIEVEVIALKNPGGVPDSTIFTAFVYELWADRPLVLFADGFESGDLGAWSSEWP